jgi:hypothetical protein
MNIGELAARTGLSASATRSYEKVGILAPVRIAKSRKWGKTSKIAGVGTLPFQRGTVGQHSPAILAAALLPILVPSRIGKD